MYAFKFPSMKGRKVLGLLPSSPPHFQSIRNTEGELNLFLKISRQCCQEKYVLLKRPLCPLLIITMRKANFTMSLCMLESKRSFCEHILRRV